MDTAKAADVAIRNVQKEGLTDIFDRPFEVDLLSEADFRDRVCESIVRSIEAGGLSGLGVNGIDHVLLPKSSPFSFRRCALMHPMDTLKYFTLVLTIADTIEKARIPIQKKRVYSYRFKRNKGYVFNRHYTITAFKNMTAHKAKRKKTRLVVSCDIANFYDRLNLHRLENTLLSIGCERSKVKLINELLLFWSGRDSYGLPVGSNASRILAEASLIGVDAHLESLGVDFTRFVDDYRIFAPDAHTAHYCLTLLIDRLWQEGLAINTSKTKIESCEKFKTKGTEEQPESKDEKRKKDPDRNPFVIRAGYGGTIPTKFREPSKKERERLNQLNLAEVASSIDATALLEADAVIEAVKASIAQGQFGFLVKIIAVLDRYLQLTPYVVDALVKHVAHLTEQEREEIKKVFATKLRNDDYVPEYLALSYIRILGQEAFCDKDVLMECFRTLKRNAGAYIGRALLDSLYDLVEREDVLEIRKGFNRADLWEKRQIIRIVRKILDDDEARPWLKNIKLVEPDELFLQEIAGPTKTKKKSKTKKKPHKSRR